MITASSDNFSVHRCFVCSRDTCQLITHRLASLESLRRVSKSKKSNQKEFGRPCDAKQEHRTTGVDKELIQLPIPELTRQQSAQFYDFFTRQGSSLYDVHRALSFDVAHYPDLFSQATRNPALCMSIVAMSATYQGIHDRNLDAPDDQILTTYADTFRMVRSQIERESSTGISEATMMASINIMMCCGVAFNDSSATLTHWHGVQALFNMPRPKFYSGAIVGLMNALEHWMVLTCSVKPRNDEWQIPVSCEVTVFQKYGWSLDNFTKSPMVDRDPWTPRIMQLASNSCRATEIMEYRANEDTAVRAPPETYLFYLRGTVAQQGMIALSKLRNSNTLLECVAIALNLYYIVVLRRTPWRAPLHQLCAELRRALSHWELLSKLSQAHNLKHRISTATAEPEGNFLLEDLQIWMLVLSTCAARISRDEVNLRWTIEQLQKTRLQDTIAKGSEWRLRLLLILKSFCWSDRFLSAPLQDVCALLEDENPLSRTNSIWENTPGGIADFGLKREPSTTSKLPRR